jgi:hypothetical protein
MDTCRQFADNDLLGLFRCVMGKKMGQGWKTLWVEAGEHECWPWLGRISPITGYGKKQYCKKTFLAHRWVYEQRVGPIPGGMVIDHTCRNRSCVNPRHLRVVSQTENVRSGDACKLTREQALEIKAAKSSKKWGDGAKLARKYGVSGALIHDIWNGRAWADV